MQKTLARFKSVMCKDTFINNKVVTLEFENLSKEHKISFWKEVTIDIKECINLCKKSISKEIQEYLSHNELGIA